MAHKRKSSSKENNSMADSDGASDDELKSSAPPEKRADQRSCEWSPYPQSSPKASQEQPMSHSKSETQRRSPCGSPDGAAGLNPGTPIESNAEETCSNGNKDEEDDDAEDENDDEKMDAQYDPERLKAFNMFVRLFVDENLDRIVPISKQPKEKIQAIIDACSRQFPEFSDRTRKRIRTYLKSCRRNKRTREPGVWENARPTPPHLTSIQAEQILATACDNESENAKRMRRGLEPVSQPNPLTPQPTVTQTQVLGTDRSAALFEAAALVKAEATNGTKAVDRTLVNGSTAAYQTGFAQNFAKTSPGLPSQPNVSMLLPTTVTASSGTSISPGTTGGTCQVLSNGPTDLSLKGIAASKGLARPSLNPVEVAAVRQLITGYRESAAFLLRSADELENLLTHQTNP